MANKKNIVTNLPTEYSGNCLFHCTSLPHESRTSCGRKDITMESCLRGGCCWDENEVEYSKKCFHSARKPLSIIFIHNRKNCFIAKQ